MIYMVEKKNTDVIELYSFGIFLNINLNFLNYILVNSNINFFTILNKVIYLYNNEFFQNSSTLCNLNFNKNNETNPRKTTTKTIIIGFDENGDPIEEEMTFTLGCAGKNEKCLVDPDGDNTCCDKNLKCIRKIGNFQYKVCSDLKDACNNITYDNYKKIFSGYYWNKLLSYLKQEEKSKYEDMKDDVKNKVKDLCSGKQLDGSLFQNVVKSYLEELFLENEIFAETIMIISII